MKKQTTGVILVGIIAVIVIGIFYFSGYTEEPTGVDEAAVLWLDFEETCTSDTPCFVDKSTSGNNPLSGINFASGIRGIDLTDGYIDLGNDLSLAPEGPASFEVWFKVSDITQNMFIIGKSFYNEAYTLYIASTGQIKFVTGWSRSSSTSPSGVRYDDGMWHHVVGVVGELSYSLYIDGGIVDTQYISSGIPYIDWRLDNRKISNTSIGRSTEGSQSDLYFTGSIDNVRIYQRELTATEIYNKYIES